MAARMDRRALLGLLPMSAAWATVARGAEPQGEGGDTIGAALAAWRPGRLDIHHIATGRGDATLVVGPDGTTLLIDAGATANRLEVSATPRPGIERRPGEWIARYALRRLKDTGGKGLDYLVVSHLHPDHLGDVTEGSPHSVHGDYRLTGVTDVAELLPIGLLLDRGFPDYPMGRPVNGPFFTNYRAFVEARRRAGGRVVRFKPGQADQIRLLHGGPYPRFRVRNLAANGEVWTGKGDTTRQTFPPLPTLEARDLPDENMLSIGMKISHGAFDYFAGGDLSSNTFDGDMPWRDIGGAAAQAAGPVEVAQAAHHGLSDAISASVVRALRPRAWVIPTWHITHPSMEALERMHSERLYPGPRDVFATEIMPQTALIYARLMQRSKSTAGHVVVRVDPSGDAFRVVVTDNTNEKDLVKSVTGPIPCA